jgi:predicted ATPase
MKNKIGIKNFRVFEEMTEFEIRPLTLLTGPNNSGKSSFTKLILAFKNNLKRIKFMESEEHNLESYEKILNWSSSSKELVVRPAAVVPGLSSEFCYQITYVDNSMRVIDVVNVLDGSKLISFQSVNGEELMFDDDDNELIIGTTHKNESGFYFDIIGLIELFYSKQIDVNNGLFKTSEYENANKYYKHEIDHLKQDYLLFDVFDRDTNITQYYKEDILKFQTQLFGNGIMFKQGIHSYASFENLNEFIKKSAGIVKEKLKDVLQNELELKNIKIEFSALGSLMFVNSKFNFIKTFSNHKEINALGSRIIHYVSANRGSQKRVLQNNADSQINELVASYSSLQRPDFKYLEQVLTLFEIEGKLVVERHENTISCVYLKRDNNKINLADLGFGYSQVIPIILKILIAIGENSSKKTWGMGDLIGRTFIIEEPEANLHPNLQSKFADFLSLTLKKHPRFHFIIETHSEYLLRKLQFLTAKGALNTNDTIIHYFNNDKYVSVNQPKVKHIDILADGNLSDSFGPGFYDETTKLQFDLYKINQAQNN